jgi:hypothetical protein
MNSYVEKYDNLPDVFTNNKCLLSGTANFRNARYSFRYKVDATKTVSFNSKFNSYGAIYYDGIKIYGSTGARVTEPKSF